MALREFSKVFGSDINNAPLVNNAGRYMPRRDKIAQPLGCIRVEFVIVRSQSGYSTVSRLSIACKLSITTTSWPMTRMRVCSRS